MAQKIFTIKAVRTISINLEICADTEEEALKSAQSRLSDIPLNSYDEATHPDMSVASVSEMPDEEELIQKAIKTIIDEQETPESYGDAMSFQSVPVAMTKIDYSGGRVIDEFEVTEYVDSAYVVEDDGDFEIFIQFEYDYEEDDKPLCDFYPNERIKILEAILK